MTIFASKVNFYGEHVKGLVSKDCHRFEMDKEEMVRYMTDWANHHLNFTFSFLDWVLENYDAYTLEGMSIEQLQQEYAEAFTEKGGELECLWEEEEGVEWEPIEREYGE